MDPVISPDDPQLGDAMAQLEADIAAEAAPATTPATPPADSATPAQPAPEPAKETPAQPPETPPKDGAPATKDQQAEKQVSQFAKDQVRREKSWQALNERKAEFEKLETAHKQEREMFEQQRKTFEAERAKASQPKYKPEDYETHAAQLDKRAELLEKAGEFDDAAEAKALAKLARKNAAELRANPPQPAPDAAATAKKEEDAFKAQQKEWWGKAAIDYPAVAKAGSPESEALKALIGSEPAVLTDPKGMYYAARLVTAETSAASVPTLTKELDGARAKIKELEQKLAIPGDGSITGNLSPVPFEQQSEGEQLAALERMAREQPTF